VVLAPGSDARSFGCRAIPNFFEIITVVRWLFEAGQGRKQRLLETLFPARVQQRHGDGKTFLEQSRSI
jgi:hypothetical protein